MPPKLDPVLSGMMKSLQDDTSPANPETLPEGPMRWVTREDGARCSKAVGTENGTNREKIIAVLNP